MEFLSAALLAVFLSVPVGPIGIAAGERLMAGARNDFLLIALGCILADVFWAGFAVTVTKLVPTFDIGWVYDLWQAWVVIGLILVALGIYLLRQPPEAVSGVIHRHALVTGFLGTLFWPTTFTGIVGIFVGAHLTGMLPADMATRLLYPVGLGFGTLVMWGAWWLFFAILGYLHKRFGWYWLGVKHLAWVLHGAMSVALIIGGIGIMLKPFWFE